jgi:hypothetical protein
VRDTTSRVGYGAGEPTRFAGGGGPAFGTFQFISPVAMGQIQDCAKRVKLHCAAVEERSSRIVRLAKKPLGRVYTVESHGAMPQKLFQKEVKSNQRRAGVLEFELDSIRRPVRTVCMHASIADS